MSRFTRPIALPVPYRDMRVVACAAALTLTLLGATRARAQGAVSAAPATAADSMRALLRRRAQAAGEHVDATPAKASESPTHVRAVTMKQVAPIVLSSRSKSVRASGSVSATRTSAPANTTAAIVKPLPVKADSTSVTLPVAGVANADTAQTNVVNTESPKIETIPAAASRTEAAKPESSKPETPKTEAPKPEAKPAAPTSAPAAPATKAALLAEVGFGTLRLDGLLQMWYSANDAGTATSFRIRRAEVKVSGKVSNTVAWSMMFDIAKALQLNATTGTVSGNRVVTGTSINQSSRMLQDAQLTLDINPKLRVDAGQFRLPFGNVGSSGASTLETIDRPMSQSDRARGGSFGDVRDVGVVARGSVRTFADYWVGAFNGSGESMNSVDADNEKVLVGRVSLRTPVKGLRVGGSMLSSGYPTGHALRRDRLTTEATLQRSKWLVRAEAVRGADGVTDRAGGFLLGGYRPSRAMQLVSRIDVWDPDTHRDGDAATTRATDVMAGATWFLAGDNAKLQVNLSHRAFTQHGAPAVNQLLVNLQASW